MAGDDEPMAIRGTALVGDLVLHITDVRLRDGQIQVTCVLPGPVTRAAELGDGDLVRILGEDATSIATCRLGADSGRHPVVPGDRLTMVLPIRITQINGHTAWAGGGAQRMG